MRWREEVDQRNPYYDAIKDRHSGLVVKRGWDQQLASQLVNRSRDDTIKATEPRDSFQRFKNLTTAETWYKTTKPIIYALAKATELPQLVGAVWLIPTTRYSDNIITGSGYSFERRMYGDYRDVELARDLAMTALFDFEGLGNSESIGAVQDSRNVVDIEEYGELGFRVDRTVKAQTVLLRRHNILRRQKRFEE